LRFSLNKALSFCHSHEYQDKFDKAFFMTIIEKGGQEVIFSRFQKL